MVPTAVEDTSITMNVSKSASYLDDMGIPYLMWPIRSQQAQQLMVEYL